MFLLCTRDMNFFVNTVLLVVLLSFLQWCSLWAWTKNIDDKELLKFEECVTWSKCLFSWDKEISWEVEWISFISPPWWNEWRVVFKDDEMVIRYIGNISTEPNEIENIIRYVTIKWNVLSNAEVFNGNIISEWSNLSIKNKLFTKWDNKYLFVLIEEI